MGSYKSKYTGEQVDCILDYVKTRKGEGITAWQPNTEYKEGQFCFRIGTSGMIQFYRCMRDYVSGDEFNTDPDGHMTWMSMQVEEAMNAYCDIYMRRIDETYAPIAQWQPWLGYNKNQLVFTVENGVFTVYECNTKHTAGSEIDLEKFTKLFYGATGEGGGSGISLWQPNTEYKAGQILYYRMDNIGSIGLTRVIEDHTSGDTLDPALPPYSWTTVYEAQNAYCDMNGRLLTEEYVSRQVGVEEWRAYTPYFKNQLVCIAEDSPLGKWVTFFKCLEQHTADASFDHSKFESYDIPKAYMAAEAQQAQADVQGNLIHETYAEKEGTMPIWQPYTTYKAGQVISRFDSGTIHYYWVGQEITTGATFDGSTLLEIDVNSANNAYCDGMGRNIQETYAEKENWVTVLDYTTPEETTLIQFTTAQYPLLKSDKIRVDLQFPKVSQEDFDSGKFKNAGFYMYYDSLSTTGIWVAYCSASHSTSHAPYFFAYSEVQGDTRLTLQTSLESTAGQIAQMRTKLSSVAPITAGSAKNATTFNIRSYSGNTIYPIGTRVVIRAVE